MKKWKILLIDDEPDILYFVKLNLERNGEYEVTTVNSGVEGLKKFNELEFDLVITDYKMPGMDGKEVVRQIKNIKPDSAVVLFSIYHDDSATIADESIKKADGIISKPVDQDQLKQVIEKALANKKK